MADLVRTSTPPVNPQAVMLGRPTDAALTTQILEPAWTPGGRLWKMGLAISGLGTLVLLASVTATITRGIGMWGNNIPVGWGFGIINFVWWIGIGHAGTFISAVLLLLEQKWRTSINRFAEAMTLFAVAQAGMFPLLHLGRPWFGYWLFPYPATMGTWPQVKSALPWDAAAITTYGLTSLIFFYLGLIPDLASLRDRAPGTLRRRIYGIFALGWRGDVSAWRHYRVAYGILAGIATPLVLSVHSIVSTDFAITLLPGWHSTIFPPFFVAGAIFSGFAMVLTLLIPARAMFRFGNVITLKHIDSMSKMLLVTGWIVTFAYVMELFVAWYSGDPYEIYQFFVARPFGPGHLIVWLMFFCNVAVPQIFWSSGMRTNLLAVWIASVLINLGMWAERFVIIVVGTQRDFLPSSWHYYLPTIVDFGIFVGTISFFFLLFLLFIKWVPFVPLAEVKELKLELSHHDDLHHGGPSMSEPSAGDR